MSQPDLILIPFGAGAASGTIEPIPDTRGPDDPPQKATWTYGFPSVTMTPLAAGGVPPKGQDFNGVLNAISLHTVFVGHGGQYKWSSAYVAATGGYSIGDVIQSNDGLNSYVSLVNSNTVDFNATPSSIGTLWGIWAGGNTQTQATETVSGIAKVATQAQVTAGASDATMVTPKKLAVAAQASGFAFAVDTGTANTYVCSFTPALAARSESAPLRFKVKTSNTGASTFNDGLGAVALVGGAHSALQGGELVANGDAWVQWNTSVGGGSYILLFCTGAAEQVAPATQSQHAVNLGQAQVMFSPPIGTSTNAKMTIAAASATGTFSADELIVGTALGGQTYRIGNYSKTINLATTGAGGMDTGSAPVSGWVALYAIYNPITGASSILAQNAANSVMPTVYGGANMPAGYTASALLTVLATNASSLFKIGRVQGRKVFTPPLALYGGSTSVTNLVVSIAGVVPGNAIEISGELSVTSTVTSSTSFTLIPDVSNVGQISQQVVVGGSAGMVTNFTALPIVTPQQILVTTSSSAGTPSFNAYICEYTL